MRLRIIILMLPAALLLASCGSSPKTQYFTLAAEHAGTARVAVASPVTVAAVSLPSTLDRRQMVRQTGPNTVDISDRDRWASPLDEMSRRVLSENLAARLPEGKLILPNAPTPPGTIEISVSLAQFGPDGTGRIALKGSWSALAAGGTKRLLSRDIALETLPPAAGAAGEAAGMSQLLGKLAAEIATGLAERG